MVSLRVNPRILKPRGREKCSDKKNLSHEASFQDGLM